MRRGTTTITFHELRFRVQTRWIRKGPTDTNMPSKPQYSLQNQVFFYGLFVAISILAFWLIRSYVGVIAFSLVMVIVLKPVHNMFMGWVGNRAGISTLLTLLLMVAVVIIPGWLIVTVATNQVQEIISMSEASMDEDPLNMEEIRSGIDNYIQQIPGLEGFTISDEQVANAREAASGAARWASQLLINLGMSLPYLLANTFIFLGIVGSLLPNYHKFAARLRRLSPLSDEVDQLYLHKIKAMVWSMFVGIFIIALIQGLTMGIFYWISDIPLLGLWTMISIVAAMMPLGASLIALPLGIVQLVMGNYFSGIVVLAGYLLIVANVDNIIRPRLVSKDAYLSFALVLLAALGGYELFGFFGVIYGPVLMILFLTTVDVYQNYYLEDDGAGAASAAKGDGTSAEDSADALDDTARNDTALDDARA